MNRTAQTPRIAHVISTPTGIGGAEHVMAALLAGGAERGWEQRVLNPFALDPANPEMLDLLHGAGYSGHRARHWLQVPGARRWLQRELDAFAPDVVHAHLLHAIVLTGSLPRRRSRSMVLTHHHGSWLTFQRRRLDEMLDRAAGRRFDRVVAISAFGQEFLLSRYRYPAAKVVCIPNGWQGSPAPRQQNGSEPTVICVANLREKKGHPELLQAFATVRAEIPEARLLLVGGGDQYDALQAQASALGLADAVEFTGHVDDVWSYLARADVFVLATLSEALGISVMEAMAAGLPVVASETGGIPEMVRPGVTGELVPPGEPAPLAAALIALLRDPERRRRMGEAGAAAIASHTMAATVAKYFALYDELRDMESRRDLAR